MFVPHDIKGLDKELYGFLSRYAADKYPEGTSDAVETLKKQKGGERLLVLSGSETCPSKSGICTT